MGLLSSVFSRTKAPTRLLIEVGSGSIAAALVTADETDRPCISWQQRAELPYDVSHDANTFLAHLERVTGEVADAATRAPVLKPDDVEEIHVVLTSPWFSAHAETFSDTTEAVTLVTEERLTGLLNRASTPAHHAERDAGDVFSTCTELERTAFCVHVNGYRSAAPFGTTATALSANVYVSTVVDGIKTRVAETVQRHWGDRKILFHSSGLAYASVLRDADTVPHRFTYVHIGREVTDIGVVGDGAIATYASFPLGEHDFVRAIAEDGDKSPASAADTLYAYIRGELQRDAHRRVREAVQPCVDAWINRLKTIVIERVPQARMSNTLCAVSSLEVRQWLCERIDAVDLSGLTVTGAQPRCSPLESADLVRCCGGEHGGDPSLMIAARYISSYHHEPIVGPQDA